MNADTVPRTRRIEANGLGMHVVEYGGDGPPVLMLHGFPQSSREYRRLASALAPDVRALVPDLRGAGLTDAPAGGYDLDSVCADVLALLDAMEMPRVTLVAHDWSALVGFELCLRAPERFERFAAIAVPAPYIRMTPKLAGAMARAMPHLWFQWAIATPGLGPRLLAGGRQRLAHRLLRSFEVAHIDDDDVAAYVAALREPARARAGSRLYRKLILPGFMNMMRGAYRGRVLRVPTLVLFGAEDHLIPHDALTVSADDAPDLSIRFVPAGAHFVVDDNPDEVARLIREFAGLPAR
ncbi:alpha/beta fold hydrolase [Microbacterium kyungheense]|uniref:Pimeloyl-ACP methyl ester carboxylesterase n=1 Tax=Microbacterium kyungheense TaxID=1263636 RepID=A0A543F102_9MICO|nr:alpha/beta hydrolase [Microbacterium kyungheense]TQM27504.1 pimeloyl-ACP methyl ester carboxylesterase [Microbacterium kyungheense]